MTITDSQPYGSRDKVLGRIRRAVQGVPPLPRVPQTPLPPQPGTEDTEALIEEFATELTALQGVFLRVPRAQAVEQIAGLLTERGAKQWLAWDRERLPLRGLVKGLQYAGYVWEDTTLPHLDPARHTRLQHLAEVEVGISGAAAAIAQVGALVLPGGAGQARLASLLPPVHIALVTPDQFWPTLEAWLAAQTAAGMLPALFEQSSSLTLVAGPSRSADIERILTLGVHGPREVIVICLD